MQNNHDLLSIDFACLYLANIKLQPLHHSGYWASFFMQNNHDWICIEFACLYLANIEHSAIISPWLFGFTFWYNITDHELLCIEFACLYLYIKKWSLITAVISWVKLWLLARYKHSNSMDGTAWLFCIKRWSLIATVIYWVKFRLFVIMGDI